MGVFHYKLAAIPSTFLVEIPKVTGGTLGPDDYEGHNLWQNQPDPEFLARLRRLLPNDKSWGSCEEYVSPQGTYASDLRIWHDETGRVYAIEFRYSPVADDIELLKTFLELLHGACCVVLLCSSNRIVESTTSAVMPDLEASSAMRFMRDPKGTLLVAAEDIKKEV